MELDKFIAEWVQDPAGVKETFITLKTLLESLDATDLVFKTRPGVTYSLRGVKNTQSKWPLYVMVDVIDDDPADRWLSVCFFGDTITDPDELGDLVPGGLLGEDGHCFDADSPEMKDFLVAKVTEAHSNQ
ncbi:hypothetical protein SAMN05660337_0551 [Maridesulfovibrio ferrireducens]|uniref:Uncharacterized protein n=1 Tax=Maridesulfovibrio ferrireducens TaxID=246191 RepID=A0A1G9C5L5_9BACT|nr:hypothetical protein [Maridesulfovibrio ferrireducens]SDK46939.1 hypothetical protein SAMN05660337_0551 [Maridesulfovibrio ferrireducens]